jgi:hypothetical protein
MVDFKFNPPLTLKGNVVVQTLDDAANFVRQYNDSRRPVLQDSVLRRLERANLEDEQRNAANAFRGWAEAEGLVIRPST